MPPSATNPPPGQARTQPDSPAAQFPLSRIPAANVSQVPQRSPLRYPGGKTWLVPHIREWLTVTHRRTLIEPFAGGAIVGLTAVMENLAERAILVERDPDVAAFWRAALDHGAALAERVRKFVPTPERIRDLAHSSPAEIAARGFRTLVLNRTRRAGILAPGASLIRRGENDRGLLSRWYPETLAARLEEIAAYADRITFHHADSMRLMEPLLRTEGRNAALFVDPPYTAGGKRAGRRLYAHTDLDHERLFRVLAQCEASVLMTYDCSPEVIHLVQYHGFHAVRVRMKNAHHEHLAEVVITRDRLFA